MVTVPLSLSLHADRGHNSLTWSKHFTTLEEEVGRTSDAGGYLNHPTELSDNPKFSCFQHEVLVPASFLLGTEPNELLAGKEGR